MRALRNGQVHAGRSTPVQSTAPDAVRRIVLDVLDGHVERVLLFGSWARGDTRRSSDIDVAVGLAPGAPEGLLARLRDALEQSNVPYRVDVVDLAEVDDAVRANIEREGVAWT